MQGSVHVLTVDAVVHVTKESLGIDQIVPWLVVARLLVVSVEHLLCSNR